MKYCGGCKTYKAKNEFNKSKHKKDGLATQCRKCVSARHRAWYAKNKKRKDARTKDWYHRNKDRAKDNHLKYKFGISLEEYNQMLKDQGGVCAICQKMETAKDGRSGKTRALAVDHCHATGRVRGLLCCRCDHLVGCVGDTEESLARVLQYLQGR